MRASTMKTRGVHWLAVMVGILLASLGLLSLRSAEAAGGSVGWLHTSGAKILTDTDQPHVIKAAAWFGMETSSCAPHGLWSISLDSGLEQIRSFGFNTIRLPFSNECLAARSATGIDYRLNPTLQNLTPLQIMDVVVARAEAHGLSVILDRHRPDSAAQSELWYTPAWPEARWISDWTMLAARYAKTPTVIGVDLHNEPRGTACWGCGDRSRDWAAAATRAGNAVLAVNPKLLIVVEGIEHQGNGTSTWWGGGLADAGAHPVTLTVPNRVVYSPHDYPSSIYAQSWFSDPRYPANLPDVWTANWGYLAQRGTAPILLGEFGTRYETTSDQQWLGRMVDYLKTNQLSFAYWSFNPNSGDTGGLVADDWVTPQRAKLAALAPLLTGGAAPTPPTTTSPSPSPSVATPATPRPTTPSATATPTAPTPTPTPTGSSPSPTTTGGGVTAEWQLQSAWNAGYVAQVRLTATDRTKTGWTLRWADPSAVSVANAWGMTCSVAAGTVTCTGVDWGRTLTPAQPVTVGLQVNGTGSAPNNPKLTIS